MKTAKILEIWKVNEWKWPNWTIYYINMKLDNGEAISLGKKKSDAFKVWDTVSYEVVEEGKKWKEVKEEQPKKTFDPQANNRGAMVWMAIKTAFEILYDKKAQNFKECIALAYRIFEEAMSMYNWTPWPKTEEEEEFNLPF